MSRLGPQFDLSSALDRFLYAPIAEDANGMTVTVLSAFARQDLDPWEEAADLNRLSSSSAIQKLTVTIAALPCDPAARENPAAIATRLVALLPSGDEKASSVSAASPEHSAQPALDSSKVRVVMFGLLAMLIVQWLIFRDAASDLPSAPAGARVTAQTTPVE